MLKTTLISKRAIISTLQPLVANRVYTVRQGLAKGLTRRGGLGFVPRVGAKPLEEAFLETLDFTDEIVYDVGGYEGIFTLFFASRVGRNGHVVTFEPNPANYARIIENVRLNGFTNVTVRRMALGRGAGHGSLVFPTDETARGTLLSDIQDQIWQEPHVDVIEVDIDSIDRELERGAVPPSFVKLDVEGFERDVLEGMSQLLARHHPRLYIEIHGATADGKLANATSVIAYLWSAGYRVLHVESGREITAPEHITAATEGHLYCR